jgi:hypothetical protein
MAKITRRSNSGPSQTKGPEESKYSHVEFGSTRGRWDREGAGDFAITTVNVPDRLDAQEVRARASADSAPPSVRRFHRVDIMRGLGWLLALVVAGAVAWGIVRVAVPLRAAISPPGVEAQISGALGVPVSVRATELQFFPSPRLVVTDVIAQTGLRLPAIAVQFNWRDALWGLQSSTWVLGEARVAAVELTGQQALSLLQSARRASTLTSAVTTIRFESVTFSDLVLLPGRYEAVVRRSAGQGEFAAISLKRLDGGGQLELEIAPPVAPDGSARFSLFASQWQAAAGPAVVWSEATAQGEFHGDLVKVDPFSVGARFGNLNGVATLSREAGGWRLAGNVRGADLSIEELIRYLTVPAAAADAAPAQAPFRGTAKFDLALGGGGTTVAETLQRATAAGRVSVSGANFDVIVSAAAMPAPRPRWPRRAWARDPAADAQHRDAGADELQPVDRRHRQGPPGQGGRRAGRRDGRGHRRGGHPVPHPQWQQGAGGARDAGAGRPGAVPAAIRRGWRTSRTCGCSSRRSTT